MSAMAGEEFVDCKVTHSLLASISETTHAIARSHMPSEVSEDLATGHRLSLRQINSEARTWARVSRGSPEVIFGLE